MLRILFRTAGGHAKNKELGLGHIYRCINLSEYLKKHSIYFLLEDYGGVKKVIKENQMGNIFTLQEDANLQLNIKETLALIKRKKIDILIIDRFKVKKEYVKFLKKYVKIVVISDLKMIEYNADLIVNGFIGFKNSIIKNGYGSTCLVGPKYQILNKKYEQKIKAKKKKYDLLITMGGFDDKRIIDFVCLELKKFLNNFKVKIILGPITIKSKTISKLELEFNENITVISKTKNMKKEILNCKFGICGGGITSYEFVTTGVPFAVICQYRHQLQTAEQWEKKKVGLNLGMPNQQLRKKLQKLFQNIINDEVMSKPKKNIMDGFGAYRVSKAILQL